MEAKAVKGFQFSTKLERTGPNGCVKMFGGFRKQLFVSFKLQPIGPSNRIQGKTTSLVVACSQNNIPASTLESGCFHSPVDFEAQLLLECSSELLGVIILLKSIKLQSKSQEIKPYLNGRCIYLVGQNDGLWKDNCWERYCHNSDALVEEEVDGTSVADIFKLYGEPYFRNKETEVLRQLSMMHKHVISTGGGAVVRPINWKYMHQGISVWLDVPVEALAQRITDVGTDSRPLLHYEAGDAYTKTFMRLSALFEERSEAYANANTRVSLENMATKQGRRDVSDLSPTAIAIEALEQIRGFLIGEDDF
ncbi:hypothetical protein VNO78_01990 [Psophocarpus tetragonolobus]|uniref:shikimate kinase n=1 Tax=Psophocarpus tetragonolobus TaxID=3891 RepID=A0AAN9SZK4_PSOTE